MINGNFRSLEALEVKSLFPVAIFVVFGCRFCGHPTIMKGTPKVTGIKDITFKIWNRYKSLVSSHFRYLPVPKIQNMIAFCNFTWLCPAM